MTVFQHTVPACPSCRQPAGGVHERDCGAVKVPASINQQRLTELLDRISYRYAPEYGLTASYIAMMLDCMGVLAAPKPDIGTIAQAIYKGLHESGFDYTEAARAAVNAWMGQHD